MRRNRPRLSLPILLSRGPAFPSKAALSSIVASALVAATAGAARADEAVDADAIATTGPVPADHGTDEAATGDAESPYDAWWTGSLLACPGTTVPPGHVWFGPIVAMSRTYGSFADPWSYRSFARSKQADSVNSSLNIAVGIFDRVELSASVQGGYNAKDSQSSFVVGDTSAKLAAHVLRPKPESLVPDVTLTARESFPSGRYSGLDPSRLSTDAGGTGSFMTTLGANVEKGFLLPNYHLLRLRVNLAYRFGTSVSVHEFSSYGSGLGAVGTATPGAGMSALAAAEYHLSPAWVIALDVAHSHVDRTRFEGNPGTTTDGALAGAGLPASEQLSVAPAVEYNFNGNVGVIAGVWTTIIGRNEAAFVSPTIALSTYY